MNAWTIYLVMQADSLIGALILLLFSCMVMSIVLVATYPHYNLEEELGKWKRNAKRLGAVAAISLVGLVFLPSTRTLALMIVLPAITSEETLNKVAPEAKEMFDLATEALRKATQED